MKELFAGLIRKYSFVFSSVVSFCLFSQEKSVPEGTAACILDTGQCLPSVTGRKVGMKRQRRNKN